MRIPVSLCFAIGAVALSLTACKTAPRKDTAPQAAPEAKYYKDDGPGGTPPAGLDALADAVPRIEPLHRFANRPYTVFGREYVPATSLRPYKERGVASWYGRKFHGEKTSTGEVYDMYAMTAAHPTLPLPSYARVTNIATGKSAIVRVNDRGPFLHNRVIDLSYAAANRIGILQKGSGEVEVEAIIPIETAATSAAAPLPPIAAAPAPASNGAPPVTAAPGGTNAVSAAPAAVSPGDPTPVVTPAGTVAAGPFAPPVTATDSGFVVQLAAFASNANADNFRARLAPSIASVGAEPKVRQVNGLFRVFVGPYGSRDDARRVADRLRDALGLSSTIGIH